MASLWEKYGKGMGKVCEGHGKQGLGAGVMRLIASLPTAETVRSLRAV
jgi:hypothetical protein